MATRCALNAVMKGRILLPQPIDLRSKRKKRRTTNLRRTTSGRKRFYAQEGILIEGRRFQIDGVEMYIWFVSTDIDDDSLVSAGLFCAAERLLDQEFKAEYFCDLLAETMTWFSRNLKVPFDYQLTSAWRAKQAICWFRGSAVEHISKAWELVEILKSHDILMRAIRFHKTGSVLCEDEFQVLAQPFANMRRLL